MKNNLIGFVVSTVFVVVIIGSVLIPTVNDGMINLGDEESFTNSMNAVDFNYTLWDGEDITIVHTYSIGASTVTVDGVDVTDYLFESNAQRIFLASNDFAARIAGVSTNVSLNAQYLTDTAGWSESFTFEVVDGEYTLTTSTDSYTGTVDWMVYADENGTMNLGQLATPSASFYTSDSDSLIVLGNIYTTGDNDTFYSYYNGDLTVNSTYTDDSEVVVTKTILDGYLDTYSTTISVNVGDETFTPYYVLAPENVSGHKETSESMLLSIIPLLVIVAVLCAVTYAVMRDRD